MADNATTRHEIVMEADAETLERMKKSGTVRGFTVLCDEREQTGGDNSAPPPLGYFALSLGF